MADIAGHVQVLLFMCKHCVRSAEHLAQAVDKLVTACTRYGLISHDSRKHAVAKQTVDFESQDAF